MWRLALIFGCAHTPAWGQTYFDGNDLWEHCREGALTGEVCLPYVVGVSDTLLFVADLGLSKVPYCLPNNATAAQLRSIVKKDLAENPETRHFAATFIVLRALREAFPCSQTED